MRIVIKFFPEITVKSSSVRWSFIKVLNKNISIVLENFKDIQEVKCYWDYIEILLSKDDSIANIIEVLSRISGIHHILLVEKYFFKDISEIFEKIFCVYCNKLVGKSFCVRVKRRGVHNFTSHSLECYLGNRLCKSIKNTFVKLNNSEEIINLEVKDDYFLLLKRRYKGLCGFPVGTQGDVLSLISGGFDSSISSYMFIRRGCKVHYCFFKFGGNFHEDRVYEIVCFLWKKFGCYRSVKFISVDFSMVINEILKNVTNSQIGIVLKRMMIRAAASIAKSLKISALVTGEALGQVSSQTLVNLKLINDVTDVIIFRPLIVYDKEDIITLSREIGIESLSISIPEYCGIFSKKSTSKGSKRIIELEEKKFNFLTLDISINQKKIINISGLNEHSNHFIHNIKFINKLNYEHIVIDIRFPEECERNPLNEYSANIQRIPVYKLFSRFSSLDPNRMYLLYCGRGVMSYFQAVRLRDHGFNNVNVYLPLQHGVYLKFLKKITLSNHLEHNGSYELL